VANEEQADSYRVREMTSGPSRDLAARIAGSADPAVLDRLLAQVERVGSCTRPVRLVGHVGEADRATGELREIYSTSSEPDGTLLVACGTRRASQCPACAAVYQRDAWQLIAAGLRGGKGMPASVAGHPLVFATFTAPSFGEVHHHRTRAGRTVPCTPRDAKRRCAHGRLVGCWSRHDEDDPRVGAPLCADCYDAEAAVLWNAMAPALWQRTTIYLRRALARAVGLSERGCRGLVRVRYVKVAEFQRRGSVHFHALIRLDGAPPADDPARLLPPPDRFTSALLTRAVTEAAETVSVPVPTPERHTGPVPVARWGEQVDVRPLDARGPAAARVGGRVPLDAWGRSEAEGATVRVGWWELAGFGYRIPATAGLARAAAARAREHSPA
jgi:hypothetical protein